MSNKFVCFVHVAPPPPKPHFTASVSNYTVKGDGKHSVTFKWGYKLVPQIEVQKISFGPRSRWTALTAVFKVIQGNNVSIHFANRWSILRRLLPGKDDAIYRDSSVAQEFMKMRFSTGKDRNATFTIRNVTVNDRGTYFCTLRLSNGHRLYSTVLLNVVPGKSTTVPRNRRNIEWM